MHQMNSILSKNHTYPIADRNPFHGLSDAMESITSERHRKT